jgi:hypothetical protein
MRRAPALAALALLALTLPAGAAGITGQYIEARTCDVWTGPCYANAEVNLAGKHAILGWKIDRGAFNGVSLDGLGVVAIVAASDTLGVPQTGAGKAVLIVDRRASGEQRAALVALAKKQGGALVANVVAVEVASVDFTLCPCADGGCAVLQAGAARIETRCLDHKGDKVCGNESAFFPPLTPGVTAKPAVAVESSFQGKGVNETWRETNRRGAYLGTFQVR